MSAKAPGSVLFDRDELALIEKAQVILLTGWTDEEYEAASLKTIDAILQTHRANKEIEAWQWTRKMKPKA